jgi:hypothetical protein
VDQVGPDTDLARHAGRLDFMETVHERAGIRPRNPQRKAALGRIDPVGSVRKTANAGDDGFARHIPENREIPDDSSQEAFDVLHCLAFRPARMPQRRGAKTARIVES